MENDLLTEQRFKELEERADFFKKIADHTYDWEIFRDISGRPVYVNKAFDRITGFSSDDVINGKISEKDFVHPDDYDSVIKSINLSLEHMLVEDLNFRIVRKDGTIRYLNLFAVPVFRDEEFIGTRTSIRDITLQKDFADLRRLRANEEAARKQFQDFFQKAPDAMLVTEKSSGIVVETNLAACILLNLEKDDIIGKHQSDLKKSSYEDLLTHLSESSMSDPFQSKVITKSGNEIPIEIQVGEVTFEGKHCIMEIIRDITSRIERENELRVALEHLKFHIDNSPFAVIEFDNEFRITKWSGKAEKIFGWSAREVLCKKMTDIKWIHQEDKKSVELLIENLIADNKTNNIHINRNYRKDGSVILCEWNNSVLVNTEGKLQSIHSMVRDITESEELKRKLTHSHNLMQYVIEHDRSAIALLNRNLEYIYVSKKFLEDYKVKEKDVIGRKHYEVFPDLPEIWKEVHQRTLAGEVISSDEDQYPKDDGTLEWVRWESRPWYEPDSSIGGIILYTEVITKHKEAELELIKAKEQAEESDRLKSAFLQNMSHEVRTPLNSIVGFSDLLTEPGKSENDIKEFSKIISENCDRLVRIITDVIEVSKIHAKQTRLEVKKFDIVNLITCTVDSFRELAERKNLTLTLKQDIPARKAFIDSDSEKMERIFNHLVDNALKFTEKGSVEVISEFQQDNFVFTVADTGIGIPEEIQLAIFEPFRMETRNIDYGGNGLGLSIVRAYTELLGGMISLKSERNVGTIIAVSIPLTKKEETVKSKVDGIKVDNIVEIANTVLIAEDEYSNYRYLYEVLLADKMNVLHASNGQEAIDMCKSSEDISLILMDIKMPVMNGITAARLIKEFRPDLPIIAQTAYAGESIKLSNVEAFDDLITKPINRNELKRKMKKYINY